VYFEIGHCPVKPPDFGASNTVISNFLLNLVTVSRTKTKASFKYTNINEKPALYVSFMGFVPVRVLLVAASRNKQLNYSTKTLMRSYKEG